jgi:hypothetical protein
MSGTLPAWVERLLGVEAGHEEGTIWSLEHTWTWPPWITLLFLVFAVVFVVAIYLREGRRSRGAYRLMLAAIRLCLVAIVPNWPSRSSGRDYPTWPSSSTILRACRSSTATTRSGGPNSTSG